MRSISMPKDNWDRLDEELKKLQPNFESMSLRDLLDYINIIRKGLDLVEAEIGHSFYRICVETDYALGKADDKAKAISEQSSSDSI